MRRKTGATVLYRPPRNAQNGREPRLHRQLVGNGIARRAVHQGIQLEMPGHLPGGGLYRFGAVSR